MGIWIGGGSLAKWHLAMTEPAPRLLVWTDRHAVIAVASLEFIFACGLLLQVYPMWMRALAILTLSAFIVAHLVGMYGGAWDCGCFGALAIPGWWVLVVNIALLVILMYLPSPRGCWQVRQARLMCCVTALSMLIALVVHFHPPRLVIISQASSSRQDHAPAMRFFARLPQLQRGAWKVVLYRPECPRCAREMPIILTIAQTSDPKQARWCFVNMGSDTRHRDPVLGEVPPLGLHLACPDDYTPSPLILSVHEGVITQTENQLLLK